MLCNCSYVHDYINKRNNPIPEIISVNVPTPRVKQSGSIVVCRSHQCAPAKISMSKEYIYNSLLHLFDNNNYQKALICQADPFSHVCLENYITLPINVGITPTNAYIDNVKISDVIIGKNAETIDLLLNYNLTYGGQTPDCTPSKSILFAKSVNHILMEDAGYSCKMTSIGHTSIKTVFSIDYIDLDYGYIGGNYSIGLSGPAYGGGTGYMILRLPKNAYPLSPKLLAPKIEKKKNSKANIDKNTEMRKAKAKNKKSNNTKSKSRKTNKPKAKPFKDGQVEIYAIKKNKPTTNAIPTANAAPANETIPTEKAAPTNDAISAGNITPTKNTSPANDATTKKDIKDSAK